MSAFTTPQERPRETPPSSYHQFKRLQEPRETPEIQQATEDAAKVLIANLEKDQLEEPHSRQASQDPSRR